MICVDIDDLTPCLVDSTTGETIETEVIRIKRRSFLSKFTEKNGWYTNWQALLKDNEVYALVVKGSVDIQGLVAIEDNPDYGAVYISWAVAAPQNNPELYDSKKYNGVGGHLLAIAIDRSEALGHHGDVTGFCRNKEIMDHFVNSYDADPIGILHPYQIGIYGTVAKKIREVYDYEWTDDEV